MKNFPRCARLRVSVRRLETRDYKSQNFEIWSESCRLQTTCLVVSRLLPGTLVKRFSWIYYGYSVEIFTRVVQLILIYQVEFIWVILIIWIHSFSNFSIYLSAISLVKQSLCCENIFYAILDWSIKYVIFKIKYFVAAVDSDTASSSGEISLKQSRHFKSIAVRT